MSRSGYYEDGDALSLGSWRAIVASTMRSRRGQAFLKEMLAAFDALPEKRLITGHLVIDGTPGAYGEYSDHEIIVGGDVLVDESNGPVTIGDCCAMGAVALSRKLDVAGVDPEEPEIVGNAFGIHDAMAREIAYLNDEGGDWRGETPEQRFIRIRRWVESKILPEKAQPEGGGTDGDS